MSVFYPGFVYYEEFIVLNSSGTAVDADTLPTVGINHNGNDDNGTWSDLTVAEVDAGRYSIRGTIPTSYVFGDIFNVVANITVSSVVTKQKVGLHTIGSLAQFYPDATLYYSNSGAAGDVLGINGTATNPINNEGDLATLLTASNFKRVHLCGNTNLTLTADHGSILYSGNVGFPAVIYVNGPSSMPSCFENLDIYVNSSNPCVFYGSFVNCFLSNGSESPMTFWYADGGILGNVKFASSSQTMLNNMCGNDFGSILDFNTTSSTIYAQNWSGDITLKTMSVSSNAHWYGSGIVTLDSTCTGGLFSFSGPIKVVDNSGGLVVINNMNPGVAAAYPDGRVHYDNNRGSSGTTLGVNGTITNPVSNWADALTLMLALNIKVLFCCEQSGIEVGATPVPIHILGSTGTSCFVSLGSLTDISNFTFENMVISGSGAAITNALPFAPTFTNCLLVDTLIFGVMNGGHLIGLTLSTSSDWAMTFNDVRSLRFFSEEAILDFNHFPNTLIFNDWQGDLIIYNMVDGCNIEIYGTGTVILASSCAGGSLNHNGFLNIIDNSGVVTITNVNTIQASLDTLLGLTGSNVGFRNPSYDDSGNCTQFDLCLYDTAANALTNDGETGLLHQFTTISTYSGSLLEAQSARKIS